MCSYILLRKPEFSTVTPFMAVASIISLRDLSNLIFLGGFLCGIPQIEKILQTIR
jgi:hypothetical protein